MVTETAPETALTQETQAPEVEPVAAATEAEGQVTEGGLTAATEATSPEGTEASSPAFSVDELPEWKAIGKEDHAAEPVILLGDPVEKVRTQELLNRAGNYQRLMQMGESTVKAAVKKLGYEDDVAEAAAQAALPFLNALHANNEAFNLAVENAAIEAALTPEEIPEYRKNAYSNRTDAIKAARVLSAKAKDAEWNAKVEKGDLIPRAKVETLKKAIEVKFQATLEAELKKHGIERRSGNVAGGIGASSKSEDEQLLDPNTPIATVNAILARRSGQ